MSESLEDALRVTAIILNLVATCMLALLSALIIKAIRSIQSVIDLPARIDALRDEVKSIREEIT